MTAKQQNYRNPYKLAEHHRKLARWMREQGVNEIDGQTAEALERTAEILEKAEDSNRGLGR